MDSTLRPSDPQFDDPVLAELHRALKLSPAELYPRLGEVLAPVAANPDVLRKMVTDLAWRARDQGMALVVPAEDLSGHTRRVARYFFGQRLRFDFKFRDLAHWSRQWLRDDNDALVLALAGFAAFGLAEPVARSFVTRSLAAPDADDKSRHACLHALWFADGTDDLELMLQLTEEMVARGQDDANVHYRRAGALRRLGRYREALLSIDAAIDRLEHGQNEVHQDFVRERELIVAIGRSSAAADAAISRIQELEAQVTTTIETTSAQLESRVDRAETLVTDSLFRTIEILGLFLALIGFVVGTAAAAVTATTYWKLVIAMVLLILGSLAFLFMMRWVISSQRHDKSELTLRRSTS